MLYSTSLGQTRTPVMSCPHCSYLVEGSCLVCTEGNQHPACEGCVNGRLQPRPWYKHEIVLAVATATLVSIASAIIVHQVKARTTLLK